MTDTIYGYNHHPASHSCLISAESLKNEGMRTLSGCSIGPHDTPLAVHNVPRGGSDGKFRKDNFIKEQKYNKE